MKNALNSSPSDISVFAYDSANAKRNERKKQAQRHLQVREMLFMSTL